MSPILLSFILLLPWLLIAFGGWLALQFLKQNGRILTRLDVLEAQLGRTGIKAPEGPPGLELGSLAPELELPDLDGRKRNLAEFRGRRTLLVFFNPKCGYCVKMAPDLARLTHKPGDPELLIVSTGASEDTRKLLGEHGIRAPVLMQKEMEVASLYRANGTPMGYLIDASGRVASELTVGADALLSLALPDANGASHEKHGNREIADSRIKRDGLERGTKAPGFRLPTVEGKELALEDYRGRKVLLVFSDPHCGPCNAVAPELEKAHRRNSDLQILMVSRGEMDENQRKAREFKLTFPIAVQKKWEISKLYAMFGTPIAYLIDEHGFIASEPAFGDQGILALLNSPVSTKTKEAALAR